MGCECSVRSGPLRASSINQLQIRSVCCFENNVTCVRSVILKGKIRLFFLSIYTQRFVFPLDFYTNTCTHIQ